jgi:peptide/nickel transport system substrate-binding protein
MDSRPLIDHSTTIEQKIRHFAETEISRRKMLGVLGSSMAGAATLSSLSLTGLMSACAPSSQSTTGPVPDTMTILIPGSVRRVDAMIADIQVYTVVALGCESLLQFGNDFKLAPSLAVSWSQPDPVTYVYTLRPGVKFWDGSPMTADDVVYSINMMVHSPQSGWGFLYGNFKSIEATGPMEVTIKTTGPDPTFKYVAAMGSMRVWSKTFSGKQPIEQLGTPQVLNMATGPYKFTALRPDQGVTLEANALYWGKKPTYKKIQCTIVTDEATRELAMRSGTVDGAWNVPLTNAPQWEQIPHTKVYYAPGATVVYWIFNMDKPPFNDIHARKAFAHCVDRPGLVQALLRGHGSVAYGWEPAETWGDLLSQDDAIAFYKSLPQLDFDINLAKQELALSKTPNGFSTSIDYPDFLGYVGLMMQNVSQNLKQIGVDLKVNEVPVDLWNARLRAPVRPQQLLMYYFQQDYPDPIEQPLYEAASGYAEPTPGGQNWANYRNPAMDALLTQQATATGSQRTELIKQIFALIANDVPYFPVWWEQNAFALNDTKFKMINQNWLLSYQMWADKIVPI